jgi:ribonuclease HII
MKIKSWKIPPPDFRLEDGFEGLVAGVDEAGYGAWAGPVVVAAVVLHREALDSDFLGSDFLGQIHDSKLLSPQARLWVYETFIRNQSYGHYCIQQAPIADIGQMNVLEATRSAMVRAVGGLRAALNPALDLVQVLVDGPRRIPSLVPQTCVIKGDQKSLTIALASIMAKVTRDQLMDRLHQDYPSFGWASNKGYGTAAHLRVLQQEGWTPHHRQTYKIKALQPLKIGA